MAFEPVPDRYLPNWAEMWAVQLTVKQKYCGSIKSGNRLPRGSRNCLKELRLKIIKAIKVKNSE